MGNVYTKSGVLARRIYFGATTVWENLYYFLQKRVLADGGTFVENDVLILDDGASLILTPNAFKAGKLYSAKPDFGAGDFTVDRNSTATYIGQDGLIKTALANVPRIDWSTGEAALLKEEQSINLFDENNNLANVFIVSSSSTVTSNTDNSPDGSFSSLRVETINNGNLYGRVQNVNPNTTFTLSFYVKNNGGTEANLTIYNESTGSFILGITSYFSEINNDNYVRVQFNFTTPASSDTIRIYISRSETNGDRFFWGFQLEEGTEASSYIPNNGTTVTRLADQISVPTPAGVTSITETIDGVEQAPITTIPATYSLPVGNINKVTMI